MCIRDSARGARLWVFSRYGERGDPDITCGGERRGVGVYRALCVEPKDGRNDGFEETEPGMILAILTSILFGFALGVCFVRVYDDVREWRSSKRKTRTHHSKTGLNRNSDPL